jgi:hypothetical protein
MFYGYGILNNHVPTLKATAMRVGAAISSLLTGLYAVYKAESNANDSLGTYNGTAQGGLTYGTGKSGNAFTFNGTNSYVSLPTNSLNFAGDFSINFWMNLKGVSGDSQVPISNSDFNGGFTIYYGWDIFISANVLHIELFNGTNTTYNDFTYNIASYYNTMTMFTITLTGSSVKLSINGALVATFTKTVTIGYSASSIPSIGAKKTSIGTYYYMKNEGLIDEVGIWSRGIISTEVTELYNSGTGKFYPTF